MNRSSLQRFKAPLEIRLALLWAALMHLYIYNDYFSLYLPGTLDRMGAGRIGPLGDATEMVLLAVSMLLAVPALMIFLSVALPALISRWLNVGLGLAYTAVEILTLSSSHLFYRTVVFMEIAITLLIVVLSARWPRSGPSS